MAMPEPDSCATNASSSASSRVLAGTGDQACNSVVRKPVVSTLFPARSNLQRSGLEMETSDLENERFGWFKRLLRRQSSDQMAGLGRLKRIAVFGGLN